MAAGALVVERVSLHVVALGQHPHDRVLQLLGGGAFLLHGVFHVARIPERVDEPAVVGVRPERAALEAEVTLAEAEHAVVGRGRARGRLRLGVGPEGGLALRHGVAVVHGLGVAVGEGPEVGVGALAEQQAVDGQRRLAVGLTGQRDQVGAGLGEGEGEVGRVRDFARARQGEVDHRGAGAHRFQVVGHGDLQRALGASGQVEACRESDIAGLFHDDGHEQEPRAIEGGGADVAAVAEGDFLAFGIGGLEVRDGRGDGFLVELEAGDDDGAFTLEGPEAEDGRQVGGDFGHAELDPLGLAVAFDRTGELFAGEATLEFGLGAFREFDLDGDGDVAAGGEGEAGHQAFVTVEGCDALTAFFTEPCPEARRAGGLQTDLISEGGDEQAG